jgi:hypothetical protein
MADNSIPVDEKGNVYTRGSNFLKAAAEHRQYIGFLDTDHSLPEIWEEVAKEQNIKALSDAGVKHLFLENKLDKQKEIDAYNQGKISEQELREKATSFSSWATFGDDEVRQGTAVVDMIVHAKKHGIQVHFADVPSKILTEDGLLKTDHSLYKEDPEAAEAMNKQKSIKDIDEELKFSSSLSPELVDRMNNLANKIGKIKVEERQTMNGELAEFISQKAGSDKAAILYGGLHFDQPKDLDEYLGEEKITTVALLSSANQKYSSEIPMRDLPDYAYFTDTGQATQKQTVCGEAVKIGTQLMGQGVQICESTLDMGTYHKGAMKEEVHIKR